MNKVVGLVVFALVLAGGIWLSGPPGKQGMVIPEVGIPGVAAADQVENGSDLYNEFCERCHGADRAGLETFEGEFADLEFLLSGGNAYMPDFTGLFTDEEVTDIFAYLTVPENEATN
jgi:mono/diheme cytochrome c family protein